jgi:hypothetical protein
MSLRSAVVPAVLITAVMCESFGVYFPHCVRLPIMFEKPERVFPILVLQLLVEKA